MTETSQQEVDTVFGFGRRRTHRDLVKAELGESLEHFVQAATHAAGGVGATVGPRVRAAQAQVAPTATKIRDGASSGWGSTVAAFAPLAAAATDGARNAGKAAKKAKAKSLRPVRRKQSFVARRKWPMVAGALAAGAIAGGVVAARRRRAAEVEWEAYHPDTLADLDGDRTTRDLPVDGSAGGGSAAGGSAVGGVTKDNPTVATGKAAAAKDAAAKAEDRLASAAGTVTDGAKQGAAKNTNGKANGKADGVMGNTTGSSSHN
ncbi:hypothetical protein [Micromonospora zhanjiangensis]|uniref:Uncharacterized protein n=1 Tax=Micromonospora zhanjiangensis TaxID=1522057 RepID=A0ABV8KM58_9ACTN